MLQLLTRFLYTYKKVTIPHIGTLDLKEEPAYLSFVDKLIHPPVYSITFNENSTLDDNQVRFLSKEMGIEYHIAENDLLQVARRISEYLNNKEFVWNGVGTFKRTDNKIFFKATKFDHLHPPVLATQVLRENVQHKVLVGDRTITSNKNDEEVISRKQRKSVHLMPYWILLLVALLFIVFYFYKEGFNTSSAGYKGKVKQATPVPTYQK